MSDKNRLSKEMLDDLDVPTTDNNNVPLTHREREVLAVNKRRGNTIVNKNRTSYMAQENVKEFNKEFYKKALIGRPMRWDSVEELEKELGEYFDLCMRTDIVPTVTSIATWLHCNRDTIYAHANNPNSPYSDILKNVIDICHSSLENGAVDGKVNAVLYMFMSKNYFGLHDDKSITITPSSDPTITNNQATMDALQKQLAEENVPNATFIESSND